MVAWYALRCQDIMQREIDGMTTKQVFRSLWRDRRNVARGSEEHDYMTRALRKLAWIIAGKPSQEWTE